MASFFVVLLMVLIAEFISGQKIAQQKCAEYRKKTIQETTVIALVLNPEPVKYSSFNCSKTVELIVGGEVASPHEFPHQALLGWRNEEDSAEEYRFDCGGSLISERYILTAAHCRKKCPQIVRLGEHNLKDGFSNRVDLEVEECRKHPQYSIKASYHDIALIKLVEDVRFSEVIRPACLWTGMNLNVSSVIATGFGSLEDNGPRSEVLRKVMLDSLDPEECVDAFISTKHLRSGFKNEQLCFGSIRGGKDTCQGDSGGPIQVITEPKGCIYHVIGVTSAGAGCGNERSPAIYTRVASYIGWIESIVWNQDSNERPIHHPVDLSRP